jgi:deazaflavin-dependent oxidoreductase (nitroreductase family)
MSANDSELARRRRLPLAGARKRRVSKFATVRVLNPIVRRLVEWGVFPRTHALLETTGRNSGEPRRTPVGNGLRGDEFWIVTEHGWAADYVKNIQRNPQVRVKVGREWHPGTARILPDEDPRERLRKLHRPVNDSLLKAVGTEMLVIRVDLDSGR